MAKRSHDSLSPDRARSGYQFDARVQRNSRLTGQKWRKLRIKAFQGLQTYVDFHKLRDNKEVF